MISVACFALGCLITWLWRDFDAAKKPSLELITLTGLCYLYIVWH